MGFLQFFCQGCTTGKHSNEKPPEPEKTEKVENEELVSIDYNGSNYN